MRASHNAFAVISLAALAAAPASLAQEPHDDPTVKGTTGLFVVPRASTLQPGTFAIGGFYQAVAREEGDSNTETIGLAGGFALAVNDRVEIFGSFEPRVGIERDFNNVTDPVLARRLNDHPFATQAGWTDGIGDLRLGVKAKLAGEPMQYNGIALAGEIKLPTADDDAGVGTGKFDFMPMVIGSYEVQEKVGLNAFLGYEVKGDPDEIEVGNEFHYGFGAQLPTRHWIQAIVELYGTSVGDKADPVAESVIPMGIGLDRTILQGGFRITHEKGFAFDAAYNANLTMDDEVDGNTLSRYGWLAKVSYSRSRPEPVVFEGTSPMSLPPVNRPPTLSCRAERTTLRQGESVRLFADVSDPDGDPVTVTWNTQAGSLSSTEGEEVTWSSQGVQPGTGPVVAQVSDGYGGTDECEIRLTVEAPPPPAEPVIVELECTDFASGSTRIDNRCKAVLDDVALRMRQNPTATAVITGYTDNTGSAEANQEASQERADNARTYLVETHGISAGRIETAGAGPASPIADNSTAEGRSRNRRIEIVITIPPR